MTTERPERVTAALAERELDLLLVSHLVNVRWLTGFTGSSRRGRHRCATRARFLTDFRYLSQSEEQLDGSWQREIVQDLLEPRSRGLPAEGAVRLGFDDDHMSVKQHAKLRRLAPENVELVAAGGLIEDLRMVKDAEEIARIRAAALLADAALEAVLGRGLAGRTEQEVAFDLETEMRRMGAEGPSFPSIVASGAHGALPHAVPRDVEIPDGVLVDDRLGRAARRLRLGLHADVRDRAISDARPRHLRARPARPGGRPRGRAPGSDGQGGRRRRAARSSTRPATPSTSATGSGTGSGSRSTRGPRLSRLGDVALAPGHVVTVEPGVYVPGDAGVRIEDLVVVTEDGHDVLSHAVQGAHDRPLSARGGYSAAGVGPMGTPCPCPDS